MSEEITQIKEIDKDTLIPKIVAMFKEAMPTRPSAQGMSADKIRENLCLPVTDVNFSALAEIERVITEANDLFTSLFGKLEGEGELDGRVTANTEALGDLKAFVGEGLPECVIEETVIAYIKSVDAAVANKSAVKVGGVLQTEWDAGGVVKEAALTETLKSYVLQTVLTETLKSYTKQTDFTSLKNTVDNFFSDDAAINDTVDTLKEIADAFSTNKDVVDALNTAIGSKVGTEAYNAKVAELEGDIAGKLDAKFEAIADNKIRLVVAYPDGSIKAENIATGGSY